MLTAISRNASSIDRRTHFHEITPGRSREIALCAAAVFFFMTKKKSLASTPAALGFRMPAEWEPQVAIWLSWPHNKKTWPGYFRPIPAKFAEIAATISRYEEVRFNIVALISIAFWSFSLKKPK